MGYEVIWDGTARTARTLDVISHPAEDIRRYWQTIGDSAPSQPESTTTRGQAHTDYRCRTCGVGRIPPGKARVGTKQCRACINKSRLNYPPLPAVITKPVPCVACATGHVSPSRAKNGERKCKACYAAARGATPCKTCGGALSPADTRHHQYECRACRYVRAGK